MNKKLSEADKEWYFSRLEELAAEAVLPSRKNNTVTYHSSIRSDESHVKSADPEELAHAVMIALLSGDVYKYTTASIGHEIHFAHGSKGSKSDEVDVIVYDDDDLPFAMVELKSANEFENEKNEAIKNQLFGTAPLVGSPRLLVYATVEPKGPEPNIKCICIDYSKFKSYDAWVDAGEPHSTFFPKEYFEIDYAPIACGTENDLDLDGSHADFRAIASSFHNEFFGEHPDNAIFVNLVKCLLAKIHDERTRKKGEPYEFQVFQKAGKPDDSGTVFLRVNELYQAAYKRYIDPNAAEVDEINPKEFSEERVKTVVQALQGISITKGAARHGDVIGAFFEEILRSGFKQDRGMYFTHDNLVRFMIEAVDLAGLTEKTWTESNHPDNRLPYVIDPACGAGTFLLHSMNRITSTVRNAEDSLVVDHDSEQFFKARLSADQPNYWAENFVYGFDPKFIMAITAKVNMVLHGDGSAHIFKDDAFRPFSSYDNVRLRACSDSQRSIPRAQYKPELCESFDLIVSNPPFGVTLAAETRTKLSTTFELPNTTPSEGLFIERCFQLLKPKGRMAIVLPESLLNAKDLSRVRLFLFRTFHLKAVVSMPRNLFIDTPTLTSLVFAQKKSGAEIERWDKLWAKSYADVEKRIKSASRALTKGYSEKHTGTEVANKFMSSLEPIIDADAWISKSGRSPALLPFKKDWSGLSGGDAAVYYREMLKTSGFKSLCENFVFSEVASAEDYDFPVFEVDEVGYKLSKRKEKARPNQLCAFKKAGSGEIVTNLHLADDECTVMINTESPSTVLDEIRSAIEWE